MPEPGSPQSDLAYWLAREPRPSEFVYVVQAERQRPIKIGRAVDVPKRVASLQTGNPHRLELLAVVPGDAELEWQLHNGLREFRLVGEWFVGGDQMDEFLDFVGGLARFMIEQDAPPEPIPDYRRFGEGWVHRRTGQKPSKVTFVEPNPTPPEERLFREEREAFGSRIAERRREERAA